MESGMLFHDLGAATENRNPKALLGDPRVALSPLNL